MKNSALRKVLSVLAIVSGALLVSFLLVYTLTPIAYGGNGQTIGETFRLHSFAYYQSFVFPFDKDNALTGEYVGLISAFMHPATMPLTLSIIQYVVSSLFLILIILGIVFVCTHKKSNFSLYALAIAASGYVAGLLISVGHSWLGRASISFTANPQLYNIGGGICNVLTFALACLFCASVIATTIFGMIYAAKAMQKEEVPEVEEEPKSIAEAAGDPEAVQEGEELLAPAEALVVESEPEPVAEEACEPVEVEEAAPVEEPSEVQEEPKVEPEPKEDSQHVEVNVNNNPANSGGLDQASLASLLREVVRDIVRDEIARNNLNQPQQPQQSPNGNQTITGATFGGPLVVQYFNGGINGVSTPTPTPAPVVEEKKEEVKPVTEEKKEEPAPAPVVEEKKEEVKPANRQLFVKKEPVEAPKVDAQPDQKPAEEPKKYERLTFAERLLQSEKDIHELYNEIKNEVLSYGVKSRISAVGDTFRLHKKMYVRITVAGKSLKLYFALNPADYADSTIPVQDASGKEMYQEIPLVFKVKSPLSVRRCKELIQDVMEKDGLEQGEIGKVNWIKELKAELASGKKAESED